MQILVNTDSNIAGHESLEAMVSATVADALEHFADDVTRVEVHLSDENAGKGGEDDLKCVMEARLAGHQPLAVTHKAPSLDLAVAGAAEKLEHAVGNLLGRLRSR